MCQLLPTNPSMITHQAFTARCFYIGYSNSITLNFPSWRFQAQVYCTAIAYPKSSHLVAKERLYV